MIKQSHGIACALNALLILGVTGTNLWSQVTAVVSGTVTDSSGAAIPEVAIQIKDVGDRAVAHDHDR